MGLLYCVRILTEVSLKRIHANLQFPRLTDGKLMTNTTLHCVQPKNLFHSDTT